MFNVISLLIYFACSFVFSGTDLYILLSVHFGILLVDNVRKKKLIITPLVIYYAGVIIVNIGNISLINQILYGKNFKTYNYIIPKYIDDAAFIWCISSVFFVIGYNLYSKKKLPTISFEIKNKKILTYIFYFLVIENILLLFGHGITLRGNQIGKIFVLLNTIGILFFARLWGKNDNKTYRSYALVLYALETYFSLLTSYLRFELILPSFYLFVGYFIGKGEIRYLFTYRIIPLITILVVFSSVFSTLQANRANFINAFTTPNDTKFSRILVVEKNETSGLLNRSANVAQITNVVKLVKNKGFYGGQASAPILVALIPRFLWPDKPKIQIGAWFALEIGAGYKNDLGIINNSINMTVAGELYLDFGWIGVILGSIFFGAFISVLWNTTEFYSSEFNLSGIIFGGYLIMISIGSYADLQIVITLLSTYLIFYAIKIAATKL